MAKPKELELHLDAWARFERAVDVVAKSPPQHRTKAKPKPRKNRKKPKKMTATASSDPDGRSKIAHRDGSVCGPSRRRGRGAVAYAGRARRASWAADPCPLLPFCYPIRRDAIEEAGTAKRLWVRFRPENID
jgi:hypothetical protein